MFLRTLLLCFFLSIQARASVSINFFDPSRFSRGEGKLFTDINLNINTIYGGISNVENCTETLSTSVCNSCVNDPVSCNTRAIHDNLIFAVRITNTGNAGRLLAVHEDGSQNGVPIDIFENPIGENNDLLAGQQLTIGFRWRDICQVMFGSDTGCADVTETAAQRLTIGVDADDSNLLDEGEGTTEIEIIIANLDASAATTGFCLNSDDATAAANRGPVCNFIAFPGDSKIFLEDARTTCDFPSIDGSGADINAIRVFYEQGEGIRPTIGSEFQDLQLGDTSGSCTDTKIVGLDNNEVTGLENDSIYTFSVGVVDEAQNVGFVLTPVTPVDPANNEIADKGLCFDGEDSTWGQNCHIAAPSQVTGLIEDDLDCFITTAAYGSPFQKKVADFRQFRNRFLHTNFIGRKIIQTYYKYSPPVAQWMKAHPNSLPVARFLLYPIWLFAFLCLNHAWLLLAGVTLIGLTLLVRKRSLR